MTGSIDQALVVEFSAMVHAEAQQLQSRLRDKVITKFVKGNQFSYDRLGQGDAHEVTSRHADTVLNDVSHTRRWGQMRHFTWTVLLDKFDDAQVLIDPQSEYAKQAARVLYRSIDRVILSGLLGTVRVGAQAGNTTVTSAATDGVTTISAGGQGATFPKLKQVRRNFVNNEVGNDLPERTFFACTGYQEENMFDEEELVGADFNRQFYVEDGEIRKAVGMEVIKFGGDVANPMLTKTSTQRACVAFSERACCLGINQELVITPSIRADKNNSLQIQADMFMGAIRTEGVLVQQVNCEE